MDDRNAFERQLAAKVVRMAGPDPHFNALEIARSAATQSPKWRFQSMFSALKFVVAGAIVALFGGFLLSGVLTQQPSDEPPPPAAASTPASPEANATWTPPPELKLEEIAPGVTQATFAGVSGFSLQGDVTHEQFDFTFDRDGDLWLLSPAGLLRVGDDTAYPSPGQMPHYPDLSLAPDGALWALANDTVASFRDGAWTEAPPFPGHQPARAMEILPDGTVWARSATRLARLDGDAWTAYRITDDQGPVPNGGWVEPGDLAWTPDGSFWVTTNGARKKSGLLRFDGEVFHPVELPVPVDGYIGPLVSGQDGELWAYLDADPPRLAGFDGPDWELSGRVPRILKSGLVSGTMVAAPDGRLWASGYTARSGPYSGRELGAYDGTTWTVVDAWEQYALNSEAPPLQVAPDGSIWVVTSDGEMLIATPEALATAE